MTIERLRELEKAATPAPWERVTEGHSGLVPILDKLDHSLARNPDNTDATWVGNPDLITAFVGNGPKQTDNGDLIAEARNHLSALLDVAEAARAQPQYNKKALREALARLDVAPEGAK